MAKPKRVHVVEDDEDIAKLILFNLSMSGYQVSNSTTGEDALEFLGEETVDLILLDLMLPGIGGMETCSRIKQDARHAEVPIIMLTARGEDEDVISGLKCGADDYMTKPFSPKVLVARIENALKRSKRSGGVSVPNDVISHDRIKIHLKKYEVTVDGKKVGLTPTEFRILTLLARKPGWVFSRTQIVESIHGQGYAITDRAVDFQMVGLRKKLGSIGEIIETVRGVGYRFRAA